MELPAQMVAAVHFAGAVVVAAIVAVALLD